LNEVLIERALNKDIPIELLENRNSERDGRMENFNQISPIGFAIRFKICQLWKARRDYDMNRLNLTFFRYSLTVSFSILPPDTCKRALTNALGFDKF